MARPRLGDTDTERMQLKITTAEVEAIDEWRYENRVPSRSEAVRRLCQIGLRTSSHIGGIGDAVYKTSEQAKDFDSKWDELISRLLDEKISVSEYAVEVSKLMHGEFMSLFNSAIDAHNAYTDFAREFNALAESVTVEDAINAADQEATSNAERRRQWETEHQALLQRLRGSDQ